jgi:putative membrane protein
MSHTGHTEIMALEPLYLAILLIGLLFYLTFVFFSNKKHKPWPIKRTFLWSGGIFCAALALAGPLAERSHSDFVAHTISHLLLGMLAPLLMVLSAPMTLLLRTLNVTAARRLTRLLKSRPVFWLSHPITAAVLNIGGLFFLYTTDLYMNMQHNLLLQALVHVHILLAGYLFTAAIIYVDLMPHRFSFIYRSLVLMLALAGHGILSKYMYANPPKSVPVNEAETGSMLMYYGGDAIDVALIIILCYQWSKAVGTRLKTESESADTN